MTSDDLLSAVARFYEAFEASDLNALSQVVTEDFIVDLRGRLRPDRGDGGRRAEAFRA